MALIDEVRELRDEVRALNRMAETYKAEIAKHEEQINGPRGISATLAVLVEGLGALRESVAQLISLPGEVHGLKKAAITLVVAIVTTSIGFAFGVLSLIH